MYTKGRVVTYPLFLILNKTMTRTFTVFDDRNNTAITTTVNNGTVATSKESRFDYEKSIQNKRYPQRTWSSNVSNVCLPSKSNILQFPKRSAKV